MKSTSSWPTATGLQRIWQKERKTDKDTKTNLSTNDEASWKVMILPDFSENLKSLIGQFSCGWYNQNTQPIGWGPLQSIQSFQHLKKNSCSVSPLEKVAFWYLSQSCPFESKAPSKEKAYQSWVLSSQKEDTVCFVFSFSSIYQKHPSLNHGWKGEEAPWQFSCCQSCHEESGNQWKVCIAQRPHGFQISDKYLSAPSEQKAH